MLAIVVDASALVPIVIDDPAGVAIANRLFHRRALVCAPELLDLEVAQTLRRLERERRIEPGRASRAMAVLQRLPIRRYGHERLMPRVWQLRGHVTAYDAAYVALAEGMRGTLVTRDARLAAAITGITAEIEVI